jgi:hypothetical protein
LIMAQYRLILPEPGISPAGAAIEVQRWMATPPR